VALDSISENEWYDRTRGTGVREALRSRPPVCGAPALILHLGLWPRAKQASGKAALSESAGGADPQDAKTEEDYNERFNNWVVAVNETIGRLRSAEGASGPAAAFACKLDPAGLAFVDPADLEFQFFWNGLSIGCLVEVHADFITFSMVLDVGKNEQLLAGQALPDGHPFAKVRAALKKIKESAAAAPVSIRSYPNVNATPAAAFHPSAAELAGGADDYANDLFDGFWLALRRDVLDKTAPRARDLFPGEPFAILYGLALTAQNDTPGDYFDKPGEDDVCSREVIQSHWPFISLANKNADLRDLVACTMLDKRAIYVTALGSEGGGHAVSRGGADYLDMQAVRYVVFVRPNPDTFELGRLIGHINANGTLRMFAMKEWRLFRRLGTAVRLYGHVIDAISANFNKLLQNQKPVRDQLTEEEIGALDETVMVVGKNKILAIIRNTDSVRFLQTALCRLESELYQYSAKFTGGLPFRVSRSKFYVRAFKERMADLGIRPIPPFQSYLTFVRRRLYSAFDYITDIAERAGGLRERLQQLLESIQSKAMIDLTHNINQLNKATADQTESLLQIQEDNKRLTAAMTELQQNAASEAESEKSQTNILFFIAVFAFFGQIVSAVLWYNFKNEEAWAVMSGQASAAVLAVMFLLFRLFLTRKNDPKPDAGAMLDRP